ncbi:hypothetical protein BJX66DRAFT_87588 [Aspergillus keveii]|uniref:Uncharacterized protein n=1 Tax=Aspergillus keveii TaxID=714993 RepID=A0ABR4GG90_9EURO
MRSLYLNSSPRPSKRNNTPVRLIPFLSLHPFPRCVGCPLHISPGGSSRSGFPFHCLFVVLAWLLASYLSCCFPLRRIAAAIVHD